MNRMITACTHIVHTKFDTEYSKITATTSKTGNKLNQEQITIITNFCLTITLSPQTNKQLSFQLNINVGTIMLKIRSKYIIMNMNIWVKVTILVPSRP